MNKLTIPVLVVSALAFATVAFTQSFGVQLGERKGPKQPIAYSHKMAVADRPEIQKLAGYFERGENIPWVKVHYLPDHVKFNHKRHLAAGFACQECHGPIQEMDVVYQYNSLKMGWCVDCHRKYMNDPKFPATLDCVACHH